MTAALPWLLGAAPVLVLLTMHADTAGSARGLGRVTGMLAAGWLAVSLTLTLRGAWLGRAFDGLIRLYRLHHLVGGVAFIVALVHPLLLALARWPAARAALGWDGAALASGWLTLLLLMAFLLAALSARLPIRAWRTIHAVSGLALAALIWHLWTVLPPSGTTASYGILLWALLALGSGAYLFRTGYEDRVLRGHAYRIQSARHPLPGVLELTLEPLGPPLAFAPAQYVYAAFVDSPAYRACGEYHAFTIASAPGETTLRLVVKRAGACTARMQDTVPGVTVFLQGPYGALFDHVDARRAQTWIAGGVGVTPFLSKLRALDRLPVPVDLYYGVRNRAEALYLDELETLARRLDGLRVFPAFADRDGLLTAERVATGGGLIDREIVLSGPPAMLDDLRKQLAAMGVAPARIHYEKTDFR